MVYRSWMSELKRKKRIGEKNNVIVKKNSVVVEDLRTDLKKFIEDVQNMQKEIDTLPKSHTALIDSASLTNFLLWKMLKGI